MSFSVTTQLASLGSPWSVKNTFVHCDVNRYGDTTNRNLKWNLKTDITSARDQSALDYFRSFLFGAPTTRDLSSAFKDLTVSSDIDDYRRQSDASADSEDDGECHEDATRKQRISFSIGAAGHEQGTCKPCAWNWKKGGCSKGAECDFCHLCEEGTVKQRRKEKLARLRAAEKAAKRAQKAASFCDDKENDFK